MQDKKKDESTDSLNAKESHKFCRVILPDNSTTVIAAKAGLSVRASLLKLCERRHISLAAIDVFQVGSDKVSVKRPLVPSFPMTSSIQLGNLR